MTQTLAKQELVGIFQKCEFGGSRVCFQLGLIKRQDGASSFWWPFSLPLGVIVMEHEVNTEMQSQEVERETQGMLFKHPDLTVPEALKSAPLTLSITGIQKIFS